MFAGRDNGAGIAARGEGGAGGVGGWFGKSGKLGGPENLAMADDFSDARDSDAAHIPHRDRAGPGRDFLPETADIGGPVARRVGLADRRRIGVRQQ